MHVDRRVPQLDGQVLGEGGEGGLRRGVGGLPGRTEAGRDRRDVDDLALAARQHAGQEGQDHPDRREVVDCHDRLDVVGREGGDLSALRDPRVVDENVDPAQVVVGLFGEGGHAVEASEVDHPHPGVGGVAPAVVEHLAQAVLPAGADSDRGAPLGEPAGQRGPDPRRGAGHQDARDWSR